MAEKETIWSFPYVILMTVNFFQSMAAFMTNTTMPLYLDELGAALDVFVCCVKLAYVEKLLG